MKTLYLLLVLALSYLALASASSLNSPTDRLLSAIKKGGTAEEIISLIKAVADVNEMGKDHKTALMQAAESNNEMAVKILLGENADVNIITNSGMTALMYAASGGYDKAISALCEAGADVNIACNGGWTALIFAACGGHDKAISALCDAGADVNSVAVIDWTALMFVAMSGRDKAIRALCEAGADVNSVDKDGKTALMYAAGKGHDKAISALCKAGADVDSVDKNGWTALMFAADKGHDKAISALCDAGADVNIVDKYGGTALMFAEGCRHVEVVALLKEARKRNFVNSFINAAENSNGEGIEGLLDKGVTLGVIDESSKRVMLHIVASDRVDMIKILVYAEAIGEAKKIMLRWAVSKNDMEMVKLLIAEGADVNGRDGLGCTPLMYAAFNENAEMVEMLNDSGAKAKPEDEVEIFCGKADVDAADENEETALMRAVESGREGLVEMLLKKRADVNKAKHGDKTALKCAACNGKAHNVGMRIVDMLLEAGAEVDECAICMEHIADGKKPNYGSGVCMHLYHESCLQTWFKSSGKNECPKCKAPFSALK